MFKTPTKSAAVQSLEMLVTVNHYFLTPYFAAHHRASPSWQVLYGFLPIPGNGMHPVTA